MKQNPCNINCLSDCITDYSSLCDTCQVKEKTDFEVNHFREQLTFIADKEVFLKKKLNEATEKVESLHNEKIDKGGLHFENWNYLFMSWLQISHICKEELQKLNNTTPESNIVRFTKAGEQIISAWEYVQESGMGKRIDMNPTHNFDLLKPHRLNKYEVAKQKFIRQRIIDKVNTTDLELDLFYGAWLNSELKTIEKNWMSDTYPNGSKKRMPSMSEQIELMKYKAFINGELKRVQEKVNSPYIEQQQNKEPKGNEVIDFPLHIFHDKETFALFEYLVENYEQEKLPSKFSHLFHFITDIQGTYSVKKKDYIKYVQERYNFSFSKIQPENTVYLDKHKRTLTYLKQNFDAHKAKK